VSLNLKACLQWVYIINIDFINDENHMGTIGKLINPLLNLKSKNLKIYETITYKNKI